MSKKIKLKVRRPTVDWYKVIDDIEDKDIKYVCKVRFYMLMATHSNWPRNRLAYQALRHYYSSDRLEYLRWCVYGEVDVICQIM